VDDDGHPDPSATIEMQNMLQRVQSLDRTDPRGAAALLDQVEQAEGLARQYKAHAEIGFANRQRKITAAQAEIAQIGTQGPPTDHDDTRASEMQGALSMFQNHVIDEKQFSQVWQDARQGTLGMKQQLQQAQADKARAEAELARARAAQGPPQPPFPQTKEGVKYKSELDTNRQILVENSKRLGASPLPHKRNPSEPLEATQGIEDKLKEDFPNHGATGGIFGLGHMETEEEQKAYEDERAALFENAGIKDRIPHLDAAPRRRMARLPAAARRRSWAGSRPESSRTRLSSRLPSRRPGSPRKTSTRRREASKCPRAAS
jgi:hypothetical protein